jgi:hypothetical protein
MSTELHLQQIAELRIELERQLRDGNRQVAVGDLAHLFELLETALKRNEQLERIAREREVRLTSMIGDLDQARRELRALRGGPPTPQQLELQGQAQRFRALRNLVHELDTRCTGDVRMADDDVESVIATVLRRVVKASRTKPSSHALGTCRNAVQFVYDAGHIGDAELDAAFEWLAVAFLREVRHG